MDRCGNAPLSGGGSLSGTYPIHLHAMAFRQTYRHDIQTRYDIVLNHCIRKGITDKRIAYIDLFAGPGRYKEGAKSTPLLILEKAINSDIIRNSLVTLFNDKDEESVSSLKNEIDSIPGIQKLKYMPDIQCEEVGDKIVKMFDSMNLVPTLFFVDPWGYKGISLKLINTGFYPWLATASQG